MLANIDTNAALHAPIRAPYVEECVVEDNPWRRIFRAGTAGSTTEYYCAERLSAGAPYQFFRLAEKPIRAPASAEADIETIIRLLKPSMAQLAAAFNVSRQRIYDWRHGDGMASDKQQRMAEMLAAARMLSDRDPQVPSGKSVSAAKFWSSISSGLNPMDAATAALARLERDESERSALKRSLASRRIVRDKDAPLYSAHLTE